MYNTFTQYTGVGRSLVIRTFVYNLLTVLRTGSADIDPTGQRVQLLELALSASPVVCLTSLRPLSYTVRLVETRPVGTATKDALLQKVSASLTDLQAFLTTRA